ncbi:MAG: hypothetical protein CVV41_13225 [Candidatus Riflebacteria bacterium HGW-Riflebacteria-1]|nr:MAG: hypothetical protein CVV41_13225 [Candidatus Riflebacteria bacterium HGW-Riflebacteria-1]
MSLRVNNNIPAVSSYHQMLGVSNRLEKSVEKLSSGLRINRAADDAAGLTISEKLRRQVRGLARATMNAQDGISMIQSAEGALNETHSILHRMRELAIQASNDTLTSRDRLEIQKEVVQLRDDINRIAFNTEFNTKKLLDGSQNAAISTSSAYARGLVTGNVPEGGDYQVSLALLQAGSAQLQTTHLFSMRDSNRLAQGDTMLLSIAQMYDSNGVFILEEPQTITLNGNSRTAEVVIDGYTSLDELAARLQNAMLSKKDGLGIDNSVANVVVSSQTMIAGLGGYLEITSGFIGEKGVVSMAGDENLMTALGISTTRAAKDNLIEVQLTDKDKQTRVTQIDCDRASGLLSGIDIQFDSQAAQIAGSRGLVQGLYLPASEGFMVEAGGQLIGLTIASGYSTLEGIARSLNVQIESTAAGSLPGLSAQVVNGEVRLAYQRPVSVSSTFGNNIVLTFAGPSSVLGFQNGSYSGFVDSAKDEDSLAWGFSQYQPGIEVSTMATLEVGDGQKSILVDICRSISAIPGVASVADMISFEELKAKANQDFADAGVNVRLDQVDGAMVFTSTLIGRNNVAPGTAYSSMVTIQAVKITATNATVSAGESMLRYFGMSAGAKSGAGDSNFRFHVLQNENQYHIGANQAEAMKVSFSEMSAQALGVNNLDMTTVAGAELAIGKLNKAIDKVSAERSKLGAFQNRLEHAITNLRSMHVNGTAAESRIRDTDVAMEMIEYTRNQVVSQSANAMLAQANTNAAGILNLLR